MQLTVGVLNARQRVAIAVVLRKLGDDLAALNVHLVCEAGMVCFELVTHRENLVGIGVEVGDFAGEPWNGRRPVAVVHHNHVAGHTAECRHQLGDFALAAIYENNCAKNAKING